VNRSRLPRTKANQAIRPWHPARLVFEDNENLRTPFRLKLGVWSARSFVPLDELV
jgi:hypothetical protein